MCHDDVLSKEVDGTNCVVLFKQLWDVYLILQDKASPLVESSEIGFFLKHCQIPYYIHRAYICAWIQIQSQDIQHGLIRCALLVIFAQEIGKLQIVMSRGLKILGEIGICNQSPAGLYIYYLLVCKVFQHSL
ncbi:hypothetical protein DSECCO2_642660 [anaerobic digester metagenome]